jgi:hypothetical protein
MAAISTEGRVFTAQLTRDLRAREIAGASALSPGAKEWTDAFRSFGKSLIQAGSPINAAAMFRTAYERLRAVQKQQRACVVHCFLGRSRSAFLELMTFEVGRHPLISAREQGVIVQLYRCCLRRRGQIRIGRYRRAFFGWHALGRLHERSSVDLFGANGIVAGCGFAGHLMSESPKHIATQINFTIGEITAAGILRASTDAEKDFAFFDVLTVLAIDEAQASKQAQRDQGLAIASATIEYITSGDPDPRGWADTIPVLPCRDDDFVSRELKQSGHAVNPMRGIANQP